MNLKVYIFKLNAIQMTRKLVDNIMNLNKLVVYGCKYYFKSHKLSTFNITININLKYLVEDWRVMKIEGFHLL